MSELGIINHSGIITGQISSSDTTQSTDPANGSAIFAGGLGVSKSIQCADIGVGDIVTSGDISKPTGHLEITTDATDYIKLKSDRVEFGKTTNAAANLKLLNSDNTHYMFITSDSATSNRIQAVSTTSNLPFIIQTTGTSDIELTSNTGASVKVTNTDDSTTSTNGSLVVSGGVGITKALRVGGTVTAASTVSPSLVCNTLYSSSASSDITIGSLLTSGSVALGKTAQTGSVKVLSSLDSSSSSTGSLIVSGGVGITKKLYVGTSVNSSLLTSPTAVEVNSTTLNLGTASNTTDINIGTNSALSGAINLGLTSNTAQMNLRSGSGRCLIDSRAQTLIQGNTVDLNSLVGDISLTTVTGTSVDITNTDNSTAVTNGALIIAGGMGIAGDIHTTGDLTRDSGRLNISSASDVAVEGVVFNTNSVTSANSITMSGGLINTNTTDASASNAAVKTTGGILCEKSLYIGGSLSGKGAVTQLTSLTTGVTLNTHAGRISCYGTNSIANGARANFTLTNSLITTSSVVIATLSTDASNVGATLLKTRFQISGSIIFDIHNLSGGTNTNYGYYVHFQVIN